MGFDPSATIGTTQVRRALHFEVRLCFPEDKSLGHLQISAFKAALAAH